MKSGKERMGNILSSCMRRKLSNPNAGTARRENGQKDEEMAQFQEKKRQGGSKETHFISIIMPAWNAERTIESAIGSVMRQTETNWELIVLDDYSEDGTYEKVRRIAAREKRIRIYRNQRNLGVSRTRNRGIKLARGRWIAFLDSDDMWRRDKLEKQLRLMEEKADADLVFTGSVFMKEWDMRKPQSCRPGGGFILSYYQKVPERICYKELLKQNLISCSSIIVRKELLIQYPMKEDAIHEDYATWLQILRAGGKAYGVNEPLLVYRISGKSRSGDKRRAAKMTWRVYRFLGLSFWQACYYFGWYVFRSIRKYWFIDNEKKNIGFPLF